MQDHHRRRWAIRPKAGRHGRWSVFSASASVFVCVMVVLPLVLAGIFGCCGALAWLRPAGMDRHLGMVGLRGSSRWRGHRRGHGARRCEVCARGATPGIQDLAEDYYAQTQELGSLVARLRTEAERETVAGRAPPPPLPPGMGLEDAPPEVKKQMGAMTCGATVYPPDDIVESLIEEMDRKTREAARSASSDTVDPLDAAWAPASPWALRAAGSRLQELRFDSSPASAHAIDHLERWFAFATATAGGMLGGGAPAASEVLGGAGPDATGKRVEVYATHLTNDDYILGASVLAASLVATGTTRPLVALVTSGVSAEGRRSLHRAGWAIMDVDMAGVEGADSEHNRGYFTKIWLWAIPADAVVYIDTDVLVVENLDHMFDMFPGAELAAAPDSQPHMDGELGVQSGLMLLRPSSQRFADMWSRVNGDQRPDSLDEWKQHEQGFLTDYFDGGEAAVGALGGVRTRWEQLPGKYNFCVRYHLRPLYDGLTPATTTMVHFACAKPWDPSQRNHAPPAYVQLYLEFIRDSGVPWRPVSVYADRLREQEQAERLEQILAERGG